MVDDCDVQLVEFHARFVQHVVRKLVLLQLVEHVLSSHFLEPSLPQLVEHVLSGIWEHHDLLRVQ